MGRGATALKRLEHYCSDAYDPRQAASQKSEPSVGERSSRVSGTCGISRFDTLAASSVGAVAATPVSAASPEDTN